MAGAPPEALGVFGVAIRGCDRLRATKPMEPPVGVEPTTYALRVSVPRTQPRRFCVRSFNLLPVRLLLREHGMVAHSAPAAAQLAIDREKFEGCPTVRTGE
jgi:hypothetical protein